VIFDPAFEWTVDPAALASKSDNTPYAGRVVRGKVRYTLLCGVPTVFDGEVQR
jgi:dihydroorotase